MTLEGRRAIVTGGASGIGAAIAERLAADGAHVAVADRNLSGASTLAKDLSQRGLRAIAVEVDVASSASVSAMIDTCVRELGGLDILVNNAGIVHREDGDVESTTEEAWDTTLAVNLKSIFLCSKHAIPVIERGGGGSIVNVSSIVAMMGSFPAQIAYTASKGGVLSMTRELAVTLARRNIRVNAVCPGLTATAMAAQLVQDDAAYQLRRLHIPMGRMARPEEIAATVAFLASDESSYMTGQMLPVDGGMTGAYLTPPDPSN
ncbi:SDR family NAD(P)-dependent oxidoreductase [Hyphomicrobium sp. DMF-1]|jgi:NAD(P)-dependent dehydrogenase (short-subunit alcohol dehydrogenase family)|uniref:SDR family NAD(P)-dependent oxidoreductase n=1 Tax=Hyphomicrobium sp. DMF-1 TaxID=3019544 RepID=UPI0022EBBA20|nr:SDR family NAD(P)-dependent oxidoreductase [Hyphomicrobium sp. DMF-1]WBT38455.1 SDR family NAD(P)-dependent oxidoreductase [Hyphomicrobium sp. DMF-1]